MQACKYCGRIMGDKAVRRHEKVCEMNPAFIKDNEGSLPEEPMESEEPSTETPEPVPDQEQKPAPEPVPIEPPLSPSFPAHMCPDTLVLKENNQMFFKVAGRRIGDVVYIEEVKMLR